MLPGWRRWSMPRSIMGRRCSMESIMESIFGAREVAINGTTLVTSACSMCGLVFAFQESLLFAKRGTGRPIYCPAGHKLYFPADAGKGEKDGGSGQRG